MNTKYIQKLEFDKIIKILSDYCVTNVGKNIALCLSPQNEKSIVYNLLKETTEATSLIYKKKLPRFYRNCRYYTYYKNIRE